jgi:N-hydroxyarylamine O-acetyltransferase
LTGTHFNINAYMDRIGVSGPVATDLASLRRLHYAHLLAVPFENLDIHWGRPVSLELDALYDKIVIHRRGGFCYELNSLFAALLTALGFQVTLLSASVIHGDGAISPEYDHLALRVDLPGENLTMLADVGWGDSFMYPLRLEIGAPEGPGELQPTGRRVYRLDRVGQYHYLWHQDESGAWEQQYRFSLQPHTIQEFYAMCLYHQASPDSPFTRKRLATRATPQGHLTLSEMRLISSQNGVRSETLLHNEDEYLAALKLHFGITP